MPLNGLAQEGHDTSDVDQMRREVQHMIGKSMQFSLDAIRSMVVEFERGDGRSESSSAEGSAAVAENSEGQDPLL